MELFDIKYIQDRSIVVNNNVVMTDITFFEGFDMPQIAISLGQQFICKQLD